MSKSTGLKEMSSIKICCRAGQGRTKTTLVYHFLIPVLKIPKNGVLSLSLRKTFLSFVKGVFLILWWYQAGKYFLLSSIHDVNLKDLSKISLLMFCSLLRLCSTSFTDFGASFKLQWIMSIRFPFIPTFSLLFYSQDICICLQGLRKSAEVLFCDVYGLNKQHFPSDVFTYRNSWSAINL